MAMELESASLRQDSKDSCEDGLRQSMGECKGRGSSQGLVEETSDWATVGILNIPPPKTHDGSLGPQLALMADGRTFKMRSLVGYTVHRKHFSLVPRPFLSLFCRLFHYALPPYVSLPKAIQIQIAISKIVSKRSDIWLC